MSGRSGVNGSSLLALIFLSVFAFLLLSTAASQGPVWDEPTTLAVGYYTLKTSDFVINYHPPLGYELSALPLLFVRPSLELPADAASYRDSSYLSFLRSFYPLVRNGGSFFFVGRLVSVAFAVLLGFLVFFWASRLYGKAAGVFALAFFVFDPVVLGNTPLAVNDVPATFFMVLAAFLFWRFAVAPSLPRLLLLGVVFALGVLSKFTMFFMLPAFFVVWLIVWGDFKRFPLQISLLDGRFRGFLRRLYHFALLAFVLGVVFVFVAFAAYRGQFGLVGKFMLERHLDTALSFSGSLPAPLDGFAAAVLTKVPVPFPSFFVSAGAIGGIFTVAPKTSFLFGEIYQGGKWQYFFVEFFLKTPLPVLLVFLFALVLLVRAGLNAGISRWRERLSKSHELFVLAPLLAYFILMLFNNENFGIRHLLPVYPFVAVFSARVVPVLGRNKLLLFAALLPLLLWLVLAVAGIHPNHFSYFNELAGGSANGYKLMVSNSDQGQGIVALKHYMDDNDIGSVKLSYFGSIDPAFYGVNYSYLPSLFWQPWNPVHARSKAALPGNYSEDCRPVSGIVAVSVTNLEGVHLLNRSCFAWLGQYEPVDVVAYSIFVYNLTGGFSG